MGAIIAVAVITLIFLAIYYLMRRDFYSEEYVKKNNWPMAEGIITSIMSEAKGSRIMVEFTDGVKSYWGETFLYVGVKKKYAIGDRVTFWYRLNQADESKERVMEKLPGRRIDALLVLCNPLVPSLSSKRAKVAWIWLLVSAAFVVLDIVLIVQHIS